MSNLNGHSQEFMQLAETVEIEDVQAVAIYCRPLFSIVIQDLLR